jgi:hypothetical protein
MAFTTSKHRSGVLVVEVEGQLIVGNRQELKATRRHSTTASASS